MQNSIVHAKFRIMKIVLKKTLYFYDGSQPVFTKWSNTQWLTMVILEVERV